MNPENITFGKLYYLQTESELVPVKLQSLGYNSRIEGKEYFTFFRQGGGTGKRKFIVPAKHVSNILFETQNIPV